MLDPQVAAEVRHERFVKDVVRSGIVWALRAPRAGGWASAPAREADREVLPFWSEAAHAGRCAVEDWAAYEPTAIPLEAFLETWLPGMAGDGVLAGTNWDGDLVGQEIEPDALREQLKAALGAGRPDGAPPVGGG